MRRDQYEAYPWIAINLFSAFNEAKQRSVVRASDLTASSFRFRALRVYVNEQASLVKWAELAKAAAIVKQ